MVYSNKTRDLFVDELEDITYEIKADGFVIWANDNGYRYWILDGSLIKGFNGDIEFSSAENNKSQKYCMAIKDNNKLCVQAKFAC